MSEDKKDFECTINKIGELSIDNKKYLVSLTDIEQIEECGRIRHIFVLTEII